MADSFLERRLTELRAGDRSVPLGFEALRDACREYLDQPAYDYVVGGAGTGGTMRANRAAFHQYRIVSRVLRDVSERDLSIELFGHVVAAPVVLAPVGGQAKFHPKGELATARAAAELDIPMSVSTFASNSIEAVAEANGDGIRFFQLYWPRDRAVAESLVGRATSADFDAIVLTVDSQVPTWRRQFLRHDDTGDIHGSIGALESDPVVREQAEEQGQPVGTYIQESPTLDKDASLTWEDLDHLRDWTDLPVVLKGILSPADARRAADWGADGIVVSNHGGRQIDGEVAALDQLPAVIEAAEGASVLLDSGVRSGVDVFKALALGAEAVLFGRPYVYGLAIAGQQGVYETTLNCLAELESVMGLSGCATVDRIGLEALTRTQSGPID